jgi:hypothetical protein
MILWRWTRRFVRWWVVTFVTGDDWGVAAAIGLALLAVLLAVLVDAGDGWSAAGG